MNQKPSNTPNITNFPGAFYRTSNKDYSPQWEVAQDQYIKKSGDVPTYNEIGENLPNFRRDLKLLKNQLVNGKHAQNQQQQQQQEIKKIVDSRAKPFPAKPEEFNYPEPGIKVGNPLYMTTNMDIGRLKPSGFEVPQTWFPQTNKFSDQFGGGMFKNNSLNTGYTFSKVHKAKDGDI